MSEIGPYAVVAKYISGSAWDYGFFSMECYTYDLKTGRELALADIFIPGFDYMPLVRRSLEKAIADNGGLYLDGIGLSSEEERNLALNEILSGTLQFCPNRSSILVLAGDVEFAGHRREPLSINLTFEEIGYENLRIFEGL